MATVTGKSRPGSVVAEAYRLMGVSERRMDRIKKTYRTKPIEAAPAKPEPKNNPKPPRAMGGKPSKRKP